LANALEHTLPGDLVILESLRFSGDPSFNLDLTDSFSKQLSEIAQAVKHPDIITGRERASIGSDLIPPHNQMLNRIPPKV
jgi:hypothetical protein